MMILRSVHSVDVAQSSPVVAMLIPSDCTNFANRARHSVSLFAIMNGRTQSTESISSACAVITWLYAKRKGVSR